MPVATSDIVRITAVLTDDNEGTVQNVYWAKQVSGGADDETFMNAARYQLEIMYGYIDQIMPDSVSFTEIRGYNLTQDYPLTTITWQALTEGGVDVDDPLPAPLCCLVMGRTPFSKAVGRKYIGPFCEQDQDNGVWSAGVLANLANFAVAWAANYATGGTGSAQFGVYSKAEAVWRPIVSRVVKEIVAYQRRRRAGRGA